MFARDYRRAARIGCVTVLWLAGSFVFTNFALAHPVPAARAILDLQSAGRYELRIRCDVAALVMQTMPGHLGAAAKELRAMNNEELAARVDDARDSVGYYTQLSFDGKRQELPAIRMPPLDVIRDGAAHGGEEDWPEIVLQGDWPAAAKQCQITLPEAIGRAQFKLTEQGHTLFDHELAAGTSSGPILLANAQPLLTDSAANWVGWIMVALLLAYLVRIYLRRP